MTRKPSFEEALRQKISEMPVPDENASWQKMNALLDEKEKRRGFFFFKNEKIAGGALLLFALMLWLALSLQTEKKTTSVAGKNIEISSRNKDGYPGQPDVKNNNNKANRKELTPEMYADTVLSKSSALPGNASSLPKSDASPFEKQGKEVIKNPKKASKEREVAVKSNTIQVHKDISSQEHQFALQKRKEKTAVRGTNKQEPQASLNIDSSSRETVETGNAIPLSSAKADSNFNTLATINKAKIDSASSGNTTSAAATVHVKRRGSYFVDIGIGIKQQIPVDSQSFSAYNYKGQKSFAGDYIPSLYIRLEKEKKWFLQGEFHYAAPRLINNVSYWQKTKADYGHSLVTADRYDLQKTWYNEIPLSLNIYIRPSWSVGIGAMYNMLRGASVKKTSSSYDVISEQYTDTTDIMPWKGFTDSFLYKTNTSLLLQTDYAVKRWSFGVRYIHDVQPFVTYTLPDGRIKDKRNQSLEVLIRYRLYRSGKFRVGKL